ncbi:hypothetical protein Dsin_018610 [Dipteronia sinensis]|uniref:Uncharacterized protein n=1 Tax=Dipteronia sinensis TaxID=43782 RepID=A0AAE0A6G4_9ROSI|nr:hypothetical protein Dsin_018610 [Dipteronia sinensis]
MVDTSSKFSALDEDGDYCNDDDSPSTASPDQSLWQSKIKNIDGVTIIGLSSPTESSSNNMKKKKQTAKKGKDNNSRVDESIGGSSRISGAMEEFNDCLQSLKLDDLRFSGFLHTWCNKRSNSCISKKLDRVLVNNDCLVKFQNSEAIFLPLSISDHCPSVVELGLQGIKKNRPFKILNFPTDRSYFLPLVERCWQEQVHGTMQYKLCSKLRNLKKVLKALNNDKAGDRNSAYFFKAINGKRNRSKIHSITGDGGSLIEGDILVKKEAIRHFHTILGCSMPASHGIGSTLSNIFDKVISNDQADFMGRDVTNDEIREVCFSLQPNKAPGPYGFNAHFFKII